MVDGWMVTGHAASRTTGWRKSARAAMMALHLSGVLDDLGPAAPRLANPNVAEVPFKSS